jgi:transposase-like protein
MSDKRKLKMISSMVAEAARAGTASAVSAAAAAPSAVPDAEVRTLAKRRQFNAAYKLSVLEEADRCTSSGAIGALLRREGLYSSHLTTWRREREAGALEALGRRRGRRARFTPEQQRIAALEAKTARLARELEQARAIIDVQKKLCTLLGLPTAEPIEDSGSES